jgi:hypothetical protein
MNHTKSHYNNKDKDVLSEAPNQYFSKENKKNWYCKIEVMSTT